MKSNLTPRNVQRPGEEPVTAKVGSLEHAAMKIGCSLPTLYDLIQGGKLRGYHIGRAHRVSEQAVADCIALLERESAEERAQRRAPNMDPVAGSRGREAPPALSAE
jgi:excisionase family DNA binding protein